MKIIIKHRWAIAMTNFGKAVFGGIAALVGVVLGAFLIHRRRHDGRDIE